MSLLDDDDELHYFQLSERRLMKLAEEHRDAFREATPFPHVVIDDFLPEDAAHFLLSRFPAPTHPVWREKPSPHQFRRLGIVTARRFTLLEPPFAMALQEFNTWKILRFLEALTGIEKLLPDPYYHGGGIHQLLRGGMLDVHADYNDLQQLDLYRCLNLLIYLNPEWVPEHEGCLELWDGAAPDGKCVKSIEPLFNRAVIFKTGRRCFHGNPKDWNAPEGVTRKSITLYYYTARELEGEEYSTLTDFQGIAVKPEPLPSDER